MLLAACSEKEPIAWKSIEKAFQTQLIQVGNGDTIFIPEGHYMFTKGVSLDGKSNVVIKGSGMDRTVLSFRDQVEGAEGIRITNSHQITIQDLTIQDAKGDNLKVSDTNGITIRRVKAEWTGGPKTENGAYALYPVLCKNVLIEESIAIGASDAGIYVGQSDSVIIRNNIAYHNVAGIEAENSRWVAIYGNEAYHNTGGILVFDLPGLTQYGHTTRVYGNLIRSNNHQNFAHPGNVVASIPPGTGMMILATRDIEITNNIFENNRTIGTGIISYELVAALNEGNTGEDTPLSFQSVDNQYRLDTLYDPYPDRLFIHGNVYRNKHWFPSRKHDIGKLFLFKFPFKTPDIAFDGIRPEDLGPLNLCIKNNGDIRFANLDAANDFEGLNTDIDLHDCEVDEIQLNLSGFLQNEVQ